MFQGGSAYASGELSIALKSMYVRSFGTTNPCAEFDKQAQDYMRTNEILEHKSAFSYHTISAELAFIHPLRENVGHHPPD